VEKYRESFFGALRSEIIECPTCGSENLEKLLSVSCTIKMNSSIPGRTCCGKMERCEILPCSGEGTCRRSN